MTLPGVIEDVDVCVACRLLIVDAATLRASSLAAVDLPVPMMCNEPDRVKVFVMSARSVTCILSL